MLGNRQTVCLHPMTWHKFQQFMIVVKHDADRHFCEQKFVIWTIGYGSYAEGSVDVIGENSYNMPERACGTSWAYHLQVQSYVIQKNFEQMPFDIQQIIPHLNVAQIAELAEI